MTHGLDAPPSVVERISRILDAFGAGPDRLALDEITAATGLPRTTTHRLLAQLVEHDWLAPAGRGYRLGERAVGLAARSAGHGPVRSAAAAHLNALQLATDAVVHLGVLEGSTVHYLDKVGGAAADSIPSEVGTRLPAEQTVVGRSLLAQLPPERVDAIMRLGAETANLSRLHGQLNRVRQRHGLAFARGTRCRLAIASVAAPVIGPHGPVGAISVVGHQDRLRPALVAPLVLAAARRTSQALHRLQHDG